MGIHWVRANPKTRFCCDKENQSKLSPINVIIGQKTSNIGRKNFKNCSGKRQSLSEKCKICKNVSLSKICKFVKNG